VPGASDLIRDACPGRRLLAVQQVTLTVACHSYSDTLVSHPNAQDQLQAALPEQDPSRWQDGAACQLHPLVRLGHPRPAD